MTSRGMRGRRRDANESSIASALRLIGALVYKLHEPADLLVGYRAAWWLLEVKADKGALTPAQEELTRRALQGDCGWVYVVRTAAEAIAVVSGTARQVPGRRMLDRRCE